ncbi:cysteine--tRNA ligase [Desulfonema ishimotonii]|uniref:Cysteine--tRNA ligase n=1 Tax=Desulfonema ishimotonii TaxID=45657 RepID=A0A401FTL1_9BACT|nr:cysteine--tRNA ligase [Desulfonema ishimotonii]GBC60295.1 cysteine--tRNA ligase [Desulfonema ishimotonii]
MKTLYLYNSLTRKKEEFHPIFPGQVGLYTCGPTVYNYAHIGNLRTYIFEDVLRRILRFNGFTVRHVMNITDVGHLTGDRDMGEDKLEKGAAREGKTAWDIAEFYTRNFKKDMARLNLIEPDIWCKATDTIPEQIALIRTLEEKGYTYRISDGIYFDTAKFADYTKLSHQNLEALQEGARVEKNPEKRNSTDFALWKFSPEDVRRQMEWDSPWGVGFPGWHIECSAMSMKYLGDQLDIHCGGTDHIDVHHTNEIAQSEAATGKPFFNFWMHGAFLNIKGGKKMAKSAGNFLTVQSTLVDKNIDPLAYRYAAFQTHYRNPMEYSDDSIAAAQNGLRHLRNQVRSIAEAALPAGDVNAAFRDKFLEAANDDLNMPRVMAVVQELLKSDIGAAEKLATVLDFDRVLGFDLDRIDTEDALPEEVLKLAESRKKARQEKNWAESDRLRDVLDEMGYVVQDGKDGMKVLKK